MYRYACIALLASGLVACGPATPPATVVLQLDAPSDPDSDGDGVFDSADNCLAVANPAQADENFPENGWALHGLAECLEELGRRAEAADVRARFEKAWARADTDIPGSCFCRTES